MPGTPRIGPKRPRRVYLAQWREARGLTQEQLAGRLGVASMTVSRWERSTALLNTNVQAAIEEALDLDPGGLFRPPGVPSLDAEMRGAPPALVDQVIQIIRTLRKSG